ncbi:RHS repeat domain-containing protein [Cohnella hashimotonis]|uniref:RHS repeat-associated core domain-containing protein n=1 Tax=Cohnella hashimotonis TaxID=2826895 RepID=A0ABT6TRY5_9BACL|nr:RHS repeat-associated core domain-containing protein [Cohnella hashimotonis]MDI4649593.1 RHS repeat-associated core domain-containing protein [Cohnella hashimotonis]
MKSWWGRITAIFIALTLIAGIYPEAAGFAATPSSTGSIDVSETPIEPAPYSINKSASAKSKITSELGNKSYAISAAASTVVPDYSFVKTKPDEAPFAINLGQESISTLSGSLSQSVADLSLPGRNGLGFTLVRKYDSDASQLNQMSMSYGYNVTLPPAEEKRFPIGKGWTWDISFIETVESTKYLHLAGSGVFKLGSDFSLLGYPWKDLTFATDTTVTVSGSTSAYVLRSIQKVNQYFNADGRLIQISDAYNNKVQFAYSSDATYGTVLTSITDAIGNSISITYSATQVTLTKGTRQVVYYKTTQNGKELLTQVVDVAGRATTYDYDLKNAMFTLYDQAYPASNPYALLTGISYPTGAKTIFEYMPPIVRKIGDYNATNEVYRIKSRKDQFIQWDNSVKTVNVTNVSYPSGDVGSAYNADLTFTVALNDGLAETTFTNEKDYIDENKPPVFYNTKIMSVSNYGGKTYTNATDYTYERYRNWPVPIQTKTTKSESGSAGSFIVETSNVYDDYGNVLSATDPNGIQTTYTYDTTSHLLVGVSQPISATQTQYTEYVRNATYGSITATRVRNGNATGPVLQETLNNTFDTYGNVTQLKVLREAGQYSIVNIGYDTAAPYLGAYPTSTSVTVKDADNVETTITAGYTYNAADGTLSSYTDGNSKVTTYQYDALGRAFAAVKPDNGNIKIQYYDYSNEIQQTDEAGVKVYTRWDPVGRKIEEGFIVNGNYKPKARYDYDANGRLLSSEDALGNDTFYGYDQWSRQNKVTSPPTIAYDAQGNITPVSSAITTMIYDDLSNKAKSTDAEGYSIEETYDKLGRLLTKKEAKTTGAPLVSLATFAYDYVGNLTSGSDNLTTTNTTSYAYDIVGHLTSVTNAKSETTSYQYDALGNLKLITYPDTKTLAKTYDEIGRLIKSTDANSKIEKFYYDKNSNLTRTFDRKSVWTKNTYNDRNFLTKREITDSAGTPIVGEEVIEFSYDKAGKRTTMSDSTGQTNPTSYSYSADSSLTSVTFPDGRKIQYDYDAIGNRIAMTDPFGYNTYYKYDAKNRLSAVASSLDFTNDTEEKYNYFQNDLTKQKFQKNGLVSTFAYDGMQIGSLIEKKADGTIVNQFGYTYDNNGNQKTKTENGTGSTFGYDPLNRIQDSSQYGETFTYDSRGNRTGMTSSNLFDSPGTTNVYDKWNRLTSVTTPTGTVTYKYNGDGLLWERTENGQTTRYYWDGDQVAAEATVSGGVATFKARYIRGQGLIARQDEQAKAYYLQNGHGDVVELRDSTGNTRLNSYAYDLFGNITSQDETVAQPFKYSGEMTDNTTKLQYLRARWYDPSLGRFINEDTYEGQIDNPLSLNLYTYVYNNPLVYTDSSGNTPEWIQNLFAKAKLTAILSKQYPVRYAVAGPERDRRLYRSFSAIAGNKSFINKTGERYGVPSELIGGIILKEVMTQSIPDTVAIADKQLRGVNHSTGIGAAFPTIAMAAWQAVDPNRTIPTDSLEMMKLLSSNDKFAIETIAVVLVFYAREVYKDQNLNTSSLTLEQWKAVVGRYNATSSDKQKAYSDKVYEYLNGIRELLD